MESFFFFLTIGFWLNKTFANMLPTGTNKSVNKKIFYSGFFFFKSATNHFTRISSLKIALNLLSQIVSQIVI